MKKTKMSKLAKRIANVGGKFWRNKADKLWKEIIFTKGGRCCAICGSRDYIQAHHLIPRNILLFRHYIKNGILLCPLHHRYSFLLSPHKNPIRFILWLQKNDPEKWKWLSETFNLQSGVDLGDGHPEVNYKEVLEKLLVENSNG